MPLTTLCRGNQIVALVPTPTSLSISNPPSCSSANDFTKGSPSTVDESGDPALFTEGIAEICRRMGVEFRFGTKIRRLAVERKRISQVETNDGPLDADLYVLALGKDSASLVRPLGIGLPIYPVKGYSRTLSLRGWNTAPTMPLVDYDRRVGLVRFGDRFRIVGKAEFVGDDDRHDPRRAGALVDSVTDAFPELAAREVIEDWAGLRPMTPDGMPIIGPSPYENLFVNTGHGHLGLTLSCGSVAVIGSLVAGQAPEVDIAAYSVNRFRL